jgi:hypothetical protein
LGRRRRAWFRAIATSPRAARQNAQYWGFQGRAQVIKSVLPDISCKGNPIVIGMLNWKSLNIYINGAIQLEC